MSAKTRLQGYQLHPILAGFPIVFYLTTFVSLCIFYASAIQLWFTLSYFTGIAALATSLLAALPGFVEWLNLPSVNKTELHVIKQVACNAISFLLISINLYLQNDMIYYESPSVQPGISLSAIAVLFVILSVYLSRKQQAAGAPFSFSNEKQLETSN